MAAFAVEFPRVRIRVALRANLLLPEVGGVGFGDLAFRIFGLLRRLETLHARDIRLLLGALRVNPTWGVAHYAADRTHVSGLVLPQQERDRLLVLHCGRIRHVAGGVAIEARSRLGDRFRHVRNGLFHPRTSVSDGGRGHASTLEKTDMLRRKGTDPSRGVFSAGSSGRTFVSRPLRMAIGRWPETQAVFMAETTRQEGDREELPVVAVPAAKSTLAGSEAHRHQVRPLRSRRGDRAVVRRILIPR
jgi:hypothetical protein